MSTGTHPVGRLLGDLEDASNVISYRLEIAGEVFEPARPVNLGLERVKAALEFRPALHRLSDQRVHDPFVVTTPGRRDAARPEAFGTEVVVGHHGHDTRGTGLQRVLERQSAGSNPFKTVRPGHLRYKVPS